MYLSHALYSPEPHIIHPHTSIAVTLAPAHQHCRHPRTHTPALPSPSHSHTLTIYTHSIQTTVHPSQSQQPQHPHRVPRQPHRHTKDDQNTTDTTQVQRPSSKSEINIIILQIIINGIKNKLDGHKLLIYNTHPDVISIQEIKFTPKSKTTQVYNFTTMRTDRLHKAWGGFITFLRDNITFTTTDIPVTISTYITELQMVKVHMNNNKHITIVNMYNNYTSSRQHIHVLQNS